MAESMNISASVPREVPPETQMSAAAVRVAERTAQIGQLVETLENRLIPVLRQTDPGEEESRLGEVLVPLAQEFQASVSSLYAIRERFQSILERLEV